MHCTRAPEARKATPFQTSPGESLATPHPPQAQPGWLPTPSTLIECPPPSLGADTSATHRPKALHQLPGPTSSCAGCPQGQETLVTLVTLVTLSHLLHSPRAYLNKLNFHSSQPQPDFFANLKKKFFFFRKIAWQFLKMLNIELPYDPAIPLPGIDPKEWETDSNKSMYTHVFTTPLFTTVKGGNNPSVHQQTSR